MSCGEQGAAEAAGGQKEKGGGGRGGRARRTDGLEYNALCNLVFVLSPTIPPLAPFLLQTHIHDLMFLLVVMIVSSL